MTDRTGTCRRETNETKVSVTINLDGTGVTDIATGNGMLDHLLSQVARHGLVDLDIETSGGGCPDLFP